MDPLTWVALGDSYTAGVIVTAGETFEIPRDGCQRTTLAYPQVLARRLEEQVELVDVSSGGATIAHIAQHPQEPAGSQFPPLSTDPDYPYQPVPPQIEAVSEKTDVITVGAGIATLEFLPMLMECITLGQDSGNRGAPGRDALQDGLPARLAVTADEFSEMLAALHERAPFARVITVGYPSIFPADAAAASYDSPTQYLSLTHGDLAWLRDEVLFPLNRLIEEATAASGDTFVDLAKVTSGHSASDRDRWIEGMLLDDFKPGLLLPNARGHAAVAQALQDALLNS
ncbi:SGNH/GDSL hydrolase family protein [Kitasatospora azatica]|uniref:SGNH/GDSL hydrolase family protein n=1 Tax=Kitasatospora azatica TaxID=58347 RepID=UPI00068E22F5|nr:SGNH/GDSL hydrolase family protein [Kitasatospora azatica]